MLAKKKKKRKKNKRKKKDEKWRKKDGERSDVKYENSKKQKQTGVWIKSIWKRKMEWRNSAKG